MKETVNVSMANIAFVLDKECYTLLSAFLTEAQKKHSAEVVSEIEASIAQQILSVQSAQTPVSIVIIKPIIDAMGGVSTAAQMTANTSSRITQRLYRDKNGAVLGGVCNGLATYANMPVAIIRLLFLAPFIFKVATVIFMSYTFFNNFVGSLAGTSLMVYIVMWIVIPRAQTALHKLEMTGDPVTVDSLNEKNPTSQQPIASQGGVIVAAIMKVMGVIVASGILLAGISAVIGLIALASYGVDMQTVEAQALQVLGITIVTAVAWLSVIVLLPCVAIFYIVIASVNRSKHTGYVAWPIFIVWFLIVLGAAVLIAVNFGELIRLQL